MPEDIFYFKESEIPTELPDIPQVVFTPIREGLTAGTLVEIEYESASEEDRKRQILPEVLFRSSENWYLAAYCMLRDEPRTFRLDRIISAENTGVEEESAGIAEDYRTNGIPWKRTQDKGKTDGENNASEWRTLTIAPDENAPEYRIPPPDPEWLREAAWRGVCMDLVRHAAEGKVDRLAEDIAAGADVNYHEGGKSPLTAAAWAGQADAVKYLIAHGAAPKQHGRTTPSVINGAARSGHMDLIRFLVEDVKLPLCERDYFGWSPVYCAAQFNHPEALVYFLEHGGDPDLPDRNGVTPLMEVVHGTFSTLEESVRLAKILLKYGADINKRGGDGGTVLHHAIRGRRLDAFRDIFLNNGIDFRVFDKKGTSSLLCAATAFLPRYEKSFFPLKAPNDSQEDIETARLLLRQGVDPNIPDKDGIVPAMAATGDFLKLLLEAGANPCALDALGRTVAMYHANFPDDLRLLQQYGADFLAKDVHGNDVLLVTEPTRLQIKFLVETFGFPIDDQNAEGVSVLLRSCLAGELDAVKYLVRHGANPAIRTKKGKTPLNILNEYDYYDELSDDQMDIQEYLEERIREKHR